MSAKQPPSTAVEKAKPRGSVLEQLLALAKTPEERERAFSLAERHKQQQLVMEMAAQLKASSWGDKTSPTLKYEIIRWALSLGADPVSEVDVLGGAPYLRANYWQRLVASDPTFQRAEETWLHDDERADEQVRAERKRLRVEWAVPDSIKATVGLHRDAKTSARSKPDLPVQAAVLVGLYFNDRGPFFGVKWSPSRATDDVGMDHPEQSARTRAWRKAALQAVRRESPFGVKLRQLVDEHRAGPTQLETTARPSLGGLDEPTVGQLGSGGEQVGEPEPPAPEGEAPTPAEDAKPKTVKHNPTAICPEDDWHPRSECPLEKGKDSADA